MSNKYVGKRVRGEILDRLAPVGTKIAMFEEPMTCLRDSATTWEYYEPGSESVTPAQVNRLWDNGDEGYVVIRWGWDEHPELMEEE